MERKGRKVKRDAGKGKIKTITKKGEEVTEKGWAGGED